MRPALFWVLTWPHLKRQVARSLLVAAGVALAVGVYAGMHLANGAIEAAFLETSQELAGGADLQISGGEAGVPEQALDTARANPCVAASTALMIRTAGSGRRGESGIAILGIDLLEESQFREYRIDNRARGLGDALVLLAQPDSILVTTDFARRTGLVRNDAIEVWTGREGRRLRVRGFLENTGPTRAYGGNAGVMDLYAAQYTFGRRGYFDRIDIAAREGPVEECRESLRLALGGHLHVAPPPSKGSGSDAFSKSYLFVVESSALLGMLVAMFLIHQAGTTSVAQREKEIGIVLAMGGDERAVFRTVLLESASLGFLGAVGGLAIGAAAAGPISNALSKLLSSAFGVALTPAESAMDWRWALLTVMATVFACVVAGLAPALHAARIPPIQLIRAARYSSSNAHGILSGVGLAGICAATALACQWLDRRPSVLYLTLPLMALAIGLAGNALASLSYRSIRPLFVLIWPLEGRLAIDSLLRGNRRTRGMLLGLAMTVATFLAISGLTAGYAQSVHRWSRQIVNSDFLIHSSVNPAGRGQTFPFQIRDRLNRIAGVRAAVPARRIKAEAEGAEVSVMAVDFAQWSRFSDSAFRSDPHSAIVSRNFASRHGLLAGGRIHITAPDGPFSLPVASVADDFLNEEGNVWIDWSTYRSRFHDDAVEMFAVYLAPGVSKDAIRPVLLGEFDPHAPVLILDGAEFHRYLDGIVARWRTISYVQVLAALLIALLGVGSFLAVSILERRREFGLLALVGATPAQIARCVFIEALAIAGAALLLGSLLGVLLQAYLLFTLQCSVNGFELPWRWDAGPALTLLFAVPAAALVAAALPWRSLNRMDLAREVECDA